jgi:HPr kinase/phosphorylase
VQNKNSLTVSLLYGELEQRLKLSWQSGDGAANQRRLNSRGESSPLPLVGYLNVIHPNQIQIASAAELDWLGQQAASEQVRSLKQIFPGQSGCLILADQLDLNDSLLALMESQQIPVLSSPMPAHELINNLESWLGGKLGEQQTRHGVMMEVAGVGVLITGPSGIGKSELALELLTRGHRLVADDCPVFKRVAPDTVDGTCPELVQDLLEVRGLGIVDVRAMFGSSSIKRNKYLRLIVDLVPVSNVDQGEIDRLQGMRKEQTILGVAVPEIALPVTAGRNLAVLIETAVRDHLLRLNGYDAGKLLEQRQAALLIADDQGTA